MNRRLAIAALILSITGCDSGPADKGADNLQKLSREQQQQWQKFRKGQTAPNIIVGFLAESREWKICFYNYDLDNHKWGEKLDLWSMNDVKDAESFARELAEKDKAVMVTALVDLFSHDSPQVVFWYHTDGDDIRKTVKPPKRDLGDSLKEFLFHIQTSSEVAKPKK